MAVKKLPTRSICSANAYKLKRLFLQPEEQLFILTFQKCLKTLPVQSGQIKLYPVEINYQLTHLTIMAMKQRKLNFKVKTLITSFVTKFKHKNVFLKKMLYFRFNTYQKEWKYI